MTWLNLMKASPQLLRMKAELFRGCFVRKAATGNLIKTANPLHPVRAQLALHK